MIRRRLRATIVIAAAVIATAVVQPAAAQDAETVRTPAEQARADALSLEALVNRVYAYPEHLPGGHFTLTDTLRAKAGEVTDRRSLLDFAERAMLLLADHHAITGSSFADSWAVVPSFADLWIERQGDDFTVTAVRAGSPAAEAGIEPGMALIAVNGEPVAGAIAAFWSDLGAQAGDPQRDAFAARVLAAGRRDRERHLLLRDADGGAHDLTLANLYGPISPHEPLTVASEGNATVIRFADSLGDSDTITAFDAAMAGVPQGGRVVLDLTDTPSGGNTVIARAIMGWFASAPTPYQMHSLPAEERETGIARQWAEYVLPRAGKHHAGPVEVRVSRWTGSMGEGLALGMAELGACVTGGPMAGLLGAIEDYDLGDSGVVVKLPTERLATIGGVPREQVVPAATCPR